MNKKLLLAGALALSMLTGTTHAEQPAAEEYRRLFSSGTFYLEYRDENLSKMVKDYDSKQIKVLASFDNKRLERSNYVTPTWVKACNPLAALFGNRTSRYPTVLHKDGKYYQFLENDKAIELDEDKLGDENLNPREGWNGVRRKLALPFELSVFCPDDPYSSVSSALGTPTFVNSYKKTVGKKEFDCDRYRAEVKSLSGDDTAQLVYDMIYDQGRMIEADLAIERDGVEYPINKILIKTLTEKAPKGGKFKIGRKTKLHAAGMGDYNDLLEQRADVGTMEGL
ncbi:MAG: hypothetical protein IJU71_03100 [Selenomonadaceae bacterium]|nr:hypothetical protein [Selenomonadaceae bacterium]